MKWIKIFSGVIMIILLIVVIFLTTSFLEVNKNGNFLTSLSAVSTTFAAIGGIILLLVTYMSLLEMRDQRKMMEEPAVTLRLVPSQTNANYFHFVLKNTGGSPAYDINVTFIPNISYGDTTLNNLNMFKRMPLLDKNEEVIFFFDSAIDYLESDKPKQVKAILNYYNSPNINKRVKKIRENLKLILRNVKGRCI